MNRRVMTGLLGGVALLAAACGGDDGAGTTESNPSSSARTVRIEMRDIAYSPTEVTVHQGETVRFVFTNRGKLPHDAFIGDEDAQADHEKDMREADGGGHGGHGDDEKAVTVEPGKTGELEHTFDEDGEVLIGCHQPGHYDAGMKVAVEVSPTG